MVGQGQSTRILCVNCNIRVNTLHRYLALELDTRVITLLCSWVYPQILTEDDYVCKECRDLAMLRVNDSIHQEVSGSDQQQAGPSHRGHPDVCLLCGLSTLRRQSNSILRGNPTELHQSMINIIIERVAPRQVTESDCVCHSCWLRVQREVRRMHHFDAARLQPSAEESQEDQHRIEIEPNSPANSNAILLPNYKRAANTNNHCVFPNCYSNTLRSISDKLRATVIKNHNYYLPQLARVCSDHLASNSWEMLFESENSIDTFTADQIQHVFSFVNAINTTLDFENVSDMDDHVFEYWVGLTKENFNCILKDVPRITEMRRGCLGLASLLLKMRTGDSDERIATLVNVSRRTLETLMDSVRTILVQDL